MNAFRALVILAAIAAAWAAAPTSADESSYGVEQRGSSAHLRVIVVGATGDLAAKYLWVACFRLALQLWSVHGQRVLFTAAARDSVADGNRWKSRFFSSRWVERVCGRVANDKSAECRTFYLAHFVPSIAYSRLETRSHYEALSQTIRDEEYRLQAIGSIESGRLLYLAVPPKAFLQTTRFASMLLRPTQPSAFFRVVIEKPFGRDLTSARKLASGLRGVLDDNEMLLIDHYAGKPGLRVIDPFVRGNPAKLQRIWNGNFISRVDIRMSETETCEHRMEYFDSNGIIRDVMANHLQLVLGMVVGPSLKRCEAVLARETRKNEALDSLCPHEMARFMGSLRPHGPLAVGQYEGYCEGAWNRSVTATAAFTELESTSGEWAGTIFSISAAKATDQRVADITITFKDACDSNDNCKPCSIVFTIQRGEGATGELIQVKCASLGALNAPTAWTLSEQGDYILSSSVSEQVSLSIWELGDHISAYDNLLYDAVRGRSDNFMMIDEVLASWKVWSPIVNAAEQVSREAIATYPVGSTAWRRYEDAMQPRLRNKNGTCPRFAPWVPQCCDHSDDGRSTRNQASREAS